MYGFTKFTMGLNDIDIGVCSTDTRMRPDIRLLELGHVDDAVKEKHRLEEKQRAARRTRDAAKATWKPRYKIKREGIPLYRIPFYLGGLFL